MKSYFEKSVEEHMEDRMRRFSEDITVLRMRDEEVRDVQQWLHTCLFYEALDEEYAPILPDFNEVSMGISETSPVLAGAALLTLTSACYDQPGVFMDLGSYDARMPVFAHLLGYAAYGIERSHEAYKRGQRALQGLNMEIPVVLGDYTDVQAYQELGIPVEDVDVFYNYDDGNLDVISDFVSAYGKVGARLLVLSHRETRTQMCLPLEAMISLDTVDYPVADVFVKS